MRIEPESFNPVYYCSQEIRIANERFFSNNSTPISEQLKLAQSILQEVSAFCASPNYSTKREDKLQLSFSDGIVINTYALDEQECLWLLDNPKLIKSDSHKFYIMHQLSVLRMKRLAPSRYFEYNGEKFPTWDYKFKITQLMPCIGYEPHPRIKEEIQFPLTSGEEYLKICEKNGFAAIVFNNPLKGDTLFTPNIYGASDLCGWESSREGLYGITLLPDASGNEYDSNPANWIYPQGFKFSERWRYATSFTSPQERDVQAYMFAQKQAELPVKGKLWQACRMLDVQFGFRDWFAPITNKSYRTHNGPVGSYAGQYEVSNDTHHVRVWGTSSTGNAWVAFDGGIFYEIKPNRHEQK